MSRFTYAWETSRTPSEEEQARLIATRFVPGRFQGRTALERAARRGDVVDTEDTGGECNEDFLKDLREALASVAQRK